MSARRFVLASASSGRLALLVAAGIDPVVRVSGVDEDGFDPAQPEAMVQTLARLKAQAVAASEDDAIVVGADSALEVEGQAYGKPLTPQAAAERWRAQRGRRATLLTGHHVIDTRTARSASAVRATAVHFAPVTDTEIAEYVATGEPLGVAGAFTLDRYGSAFIERIEGDASNVIGLSIPLLRTLLAGMGVPWTSLWRRPS